MDTSVPALRMPTILDVGIADDTLRVTLSDGRALAVPTAWYPRLAHGSVNDAETESAEIQPIAEAILSHT